MPTLALRVRRGVPVALLLAAAALGACGPRTTVSTVTPQPARAAQLPQRSPEDRFVDSLLGQMTLAEKLGQLNQLSGMGEPTGPGGAPTGLGAIERGEVGSFLNVVGADTTRKLQRIAVERSRLHIPLLFALDVIHGYRTIFPVPLGESSSWDTAAAAQAARIAAIEASAHGIDWTFAPMVDVARDPRWGRIVEGAGEDPYLGSAFAMARVRGFQGTDASPRSGPVSIGTDAIAATAKHFAAYGAAEGGRDYNIADVPERTLREVYLPPFHAAVCAGTQTLMASFNEIAGVPAHANRHLTTDILRGEWGFDGVVVSDWTGISELLNHGIGADSGSVGARALDAGVDVDMVSEVYRKALPALVADRRVPESLVNESTRRVLRLKYRLGLFRDPYARMDTARERSATLTAESRAHARRVGRESIVLLKNEGNVLPLRKDLRGIAVIGALAADTAAVNGNWQGMARPQDAVSVLDGIRRAVGAGTTVTYARGASPESMDTSGFSEAVRAARRADAVVLVIGETPGMSAEASSRATIDLPGAQLQLAEALRATGKPLVVVLMNGRPLALQQLHDRVPAILETWFLGTEHGTATADVLFGDYSPSGKLTATFPRVTGQVPIYYNHKNTGRPPHGDEKYGSRYIDVPWTPLYPFGHGLSFTTFRYSAPRLSATTIRAGDTVRVEVDVTNAGQREGTEVVQLYLRDEVSSVTRPVRELRGFERVSLKAGETRTVRFTLGPQDLAFYDLGMRRVIEPGAFRVFVGGSSEATMEGRFTVTSLGDEAVPVADRCPAAR